MISRSERRILIDKIHRYAKASVDLEKVYKSSAVTATQVANAVDDFKIAEQSLNIYLDEITER